MELSVSDLSLQEILSYPGAVVADLSTTSLILESFGGRHVHFRKAC